MLSHTLFNQRNDESLNTRAFGNRDHLELSVEFRIHIPYLNIHAFNVYHAMQTCK